MTILKQAIRKDRWVNGKQVIVAHDGMQKSHFLVSAQAVRRDDAVLLTACQAW